MSATRYAAMGFTLVELMIVVAIAAILAVLAAPSFTQVIEGQRVRSAGTDLNIAMNRARSEAIKRNTLVILSPKSAGNWANGWQIADPTNPTVLLEDHDALSNLTATGPTNVAYMSSGRVQGSTAPTIQISGVYPSTMRCVTVILSGEPQVKAGSC